MLLECVSVRRVRGTKDGITAEDVITGILEFAPMPDGSGLLMLPIDQLIQANEKARRQGILEIDPFSKLDRWKRTVLELTPGECRKLIATLPGDEFSVVRNGWGRKWTHTLRRDHANNDLSQRHIRDIEAG
uniref:Uncharacterized protein n=1 Tax=viral metagenome TaxID=1070528 RepID=A0A6M3IPE4_9ZZZZ